MDFFTKARVKVPYFPRLWPPRAVNSTIPMKITAAFLATLSLFSLALGSPDATPAPTAAPAPPPPLEVTLMPVNSAEGIFTRVDLSPEGLAKTPVVLHLTVKSTDAAATNASVSLTAEDIFNKPIDWKQQISVPLQKGAGAQDITFKAPGPGYFMVRAEVHAGADTVTASGDFGLVPPPYPGVRPDSFFASNFSTSSGPDLDLFQAIGMKVERCGFNAKEAKQDGLAPGQVGTIDFTTLDDKFKTLKEHGIWALPTTSYTLSGNPADAAPLAQQTGMYGPPADYQRYANTWAAIFQRYPEIKATEFYNEPWIFGWTFAGTPTDYDRLQKTFCDAVLKVRPDMRIIAGSSSMFAIDNIEPNLSCWKGLLSGISAHPYTDVADPSWRVGGNTREIDEIRLVSQRMGLPYAYLTEGGTSYAPPLSPEAKAAAAAKPKGPTVKSVTAELVALDDKSSPQATALKKQLKSLKAEGKLAAADVRNNVENAYKIVQYFVRAAVEGVFQGNAQWDIGYGLEWTRSNTTFAVMTHFIEDRPAVADIWPANELIWGGIFANPKFVTPEVKALPRASELSARWKVAIPKDRQDDKTKVAVIWAVTGESKDKLDADGTLTVPHADGLQAFDMTGREIPAGPDGLTVPFGNNPVYITSDTLSVIDLRNRVAQGIIKNVTPVNLYALSLMDDPTQPQKLSVRVENQINVKLQGTLHLKVAGASEETSAPFTIEAAKLAEVTVPWPKGVTPNENNQYNITISAEVAPAGNATAPALPVTVSRQQIASVARFVKKTSAMTGSVNDWKGITPVLLDSNLLKDDVDLTQYYLNPTLEKPEGDATTPRSVIRVYTAYDQNYVYLAAAVNEDAFGNTAGEQVVKGRGNSSKPGYKSEPLPYQKGLPGGLGTPSGDGDAFQFSFGFRDRVPGQGRQMNDPYAWKGDFYDVDYSYVASPSTEGDLLTRLWGADTARRNGYQLEPVPGQAVIALGSVYNRENSGKVTTSVPGSTPSAQDHAKEAMAPIKPVTNGKIKITRDETTKVTLYEIAVPRSELKLFNPATGRCRFGFIVYNGIPAGSKKGLFKGGLNWSDAAGVFDYWHTVGSFPPTYSPHTACQTFFGIEK